ncbi:hypothetical protein ACFQ0O_35060 [Saccharopolyspora spinosporotrichia]
MAGGMMPMGMMGGAMGAQGGAQERQNKSRLKSSSEELFGAPQSAPPAVYGEDPDNAKQSEDKPAKPKPLPKPPMPPKRGSAGVGDAPPRRSEVLSSGSSRAAARVAEPQTPRL